MKILSWRTFWKTVTGVQEFKQELLGEFFVHFLVFFLEKASNTQQN